MVDCSAARGCEIILGIYEIAMLKKLSMRNLFKNMFRFLRFRCVYTYFWNRWGNVPDNTDNWKWVLTLYSFQYRISKVIHGKFLNIRLYNNPKTNFPFTTVLRKYSESQIYEYIARVCYNVVFSTYLRSNAAEKWV